MSNDVSHDQSELPFVFNLGSFFLGVLIVSFGILFLVRNIGILVFSFSDNILRLWPIILVAFGFSRIRIRSLWGVVLGIFAAVLVAVITVYIAFYSQGAPEYWGAPFIDDKSVSIQ